MATQMTKKKKKHKQNKRTNLLSFAFKLGKAVMVGSQMFHRVKSETVKINI